MAEQGEALRVDADLDERRALYVCECPDTNCTELIRGLTRDEYRQIRLDPAEFVVAPGHERIEVEEVVDRNQRVVVRKRGTPDQTSDVD